MLWLPVEVRSLQLIGKSNDDTKTKKLEVNIHLINVDNTLTVGKKYISRLEVQLVRLSEAIKTLRLRFVVATNNIFPCDTQLNVGRDIFEFLV